MSEASSLNYGIDTDKIIVTHRSPFAFLKNKGKVPAEENVQTGATVPAQELDEKGQKLRGENGGTVVREVDAMDDQFRGMTPAQLEGAAMRRQMRVASWSMMFCEYCVRYRASADKRHQSLSRPTSWVYVSKSFLLLSHLTSLAAVQRSVCYRRPGPHRMSMSSRY